MKIGLGVVLLVGPIVACGRLPRADEPSRPLATRTEILAPAPKTAPAAIDKADVQARLEAWIGFLASDALGGRGTPSRELEVAAEYLASELGRAGWDPGNGTSYRQTYALRQFDPTKATVAIRIGAKKVKADEYLFAGFSFDPKRPLRDLSLVTAGYGIFAPEQQANDYQGLDVAGKAVLVFEGAPWPTDPDGIFGFDRAFGKNIAATARGAKLVVYVTDKLSGEVQSAEVGLWRQLAELPVAFLPELEGRPTGSFAPVLFLSRQGYERLLAKAVGCSYDACLAELAKGQALAPSEPGKISVDLAVATSDATASNVVASLAGAARADEWIVLSAHYDHIGTAPAGDDPIYNGADDNASGTAALLEVARRLAAGGGGERSMLILFTSGEERGLLGSAYFAHEPLVPMDKIILNINIDMVGRSTGSVQALTDGSPELFAEIVKLGKDRGIDVLPDQQPTWRLAYLTDHYHFLRFDVPSVEFFTGLHPDYHQPGDDAAKIRYPELVGIVDIVYRVARRYADGATQPRFERPVWFVTP